MKRTEHEMPTWSLSRQSFSAALSLMLGLLCAMVVSGCMSWVYERELFPSDYVRVIYSEEHCRDVDQAAAADHPDADLIKTSEHGIGRFVATRTAWEAIARQLAAELDADTALIRLCGREGAFENAQIEVWRTRGFKPIMQEECRQESDGALMAPSMSTNSTRLKDIFECLELAHVTSGPILPEITKRLGHVAATDYFTSGGYFPGFARIDKCFRPTCTANLNISMIYSDRERAAQAAVLYRELPSDEKQRFAERYLICLLERGYDLSPVGNSNKPF